ncbi:MAG TPA: response regulator, partial [Archangium sp.]
VFEPFFTTKKAGVGSGLGLAISQRIVNELHGQIRIESKLGEGTRVVVELPAYEARAFPTPAPSSASPQGAPRGRVLIVDDEELLRRALARQLKRHHEVVSAASVADAQAVLARDPRFDVVLCDLMMPERSGMEFHAWLMTTDPALAERVIFMSGGAFTSNAAEYLAKVSNPRLEKPVEFAQLLEAIGEAMRKGR